MALILDSDLLCIERGGRSYKWTGSELKSQVIGLSPVDRITASLPIVVSQSGRDFNISIRTATTSQLGATRLTNTVNTEQGLALTPKGAYDALSLKANSDGSNASGTWGINITGNANSSSNSTYAQYSTQVRVDTEGTTNANRYLTYTDGGAGSYYIPKIDGNLYYNPATNTLTTSTFQGNLNGNASSANTATNATNATNSTNATNVNIVNDASNTYKYLTFAAGTSGNQRLHADGSLYYNPYYNYLYAPTLQSTTVNATTGNITNIYATYVGTGSLNSSGDVTCRSVNASGGINASSSATVGGYLSVTYDISCRNLTANDVNSTSDFNLKKDIETITNPIDSLKQINGVNFSWKYNDEKSMGVIAQDVEKVFPELVKTDDEDLKSVNYNGIIGALVEAVKELSARVEELEASK